MSESSKLTCEVAFVYSELKTERWPAHSVLRNPQIIQLGGRGFLSGTILTRGGKNWAEGKQCYLALDKITAIVEFRTLDEFHDWDRKHPIPPDGKRTDEPGEVDRNNN